MWLIAIDDFILADYDIEPAMLTNKSSHLGFGVDRRSGIYGSVYFSSSSQPATWNVIIQCPTDDARNALIAVLAAPRNEQVRLLAQRELHGIDLVSTEAAVTSVEAHGSSDNFEVNFESNDSVWLAENSSSTTVSSTFTTPENQILHLPVDGNITTYPAIRLRNTVQRASATANVGWKYRQRFKITNGSDEPLFRYPIRITFGNSAGLVSAGKARSDGNDLRVWLDGLEQSRTITFWNTGFTQLWMIAPSIPAGGNIIYEVVYGNPSAGAPPVLVAPDVPAFDVGVSSNDQWIYHTDDLLANAGRGLWVLSSPLEGGSADYSAPGSWQPQLTFENPNNADNIMSRKSTRWLSGPNVWYQASINCVRFKGPGFTVVTDFTGTDPFDGVVIHNPFGISSVAFNSLEWENFAMVVTVVTTTTTNTTSDGFTSNSSGQSLSDDIDTVHAPFTRLVLLGRDSGGEGWHVIAQRNAWVGPETFGATYTPPSPVKHFALAVWPDGVSEIPEDANAGVRVKSTGDVTVNIAATPKLDITQVQGEVQIYELATELRVHGGANAVAPYHALLIGNARSASGAGTPRAAIASTTQGVILDCEQRTHTVWDSNYNTKAESLSAHSVRATRGYQFEGLTAEVRTSQWLPISRPRRIVANGTFDVDINSWEVYFNTGGVTAATTYDGTIGGDQLGSMKIAVTANPGTGSIVWLNSQFFSVSGQETIEISGWVRVSNALLRPHLYVVWYINESTSLLAQNGPFWVVSPVINTGYRRSYSFVVPEGAKLFRVGVQSDLTTSGVTGSVWFDDIRLNDNDMFVHDEIMGTLVVDAIIRPRWIP